MKPRNLPARDEIQALVHEAYRYYGKAQCIPACDRWLAAWQIVEQLITP